MASGQVWGVISPVDHSDTMIPLAPLDSMAERVQGLGNVIKHTPYLSMVCTCLSRIRPPNLAIMSSLFLGACATRSGGAVLLCPRLRHIFGTFTGLACPKIMPSTPPSDSPSGHATSISKLRPRYVSEDHGILPHDCGADPRCPQTHGRLRQILQEPNIIAFSLQS